MQKSEYETAFDEYEVARKGYEDVQDRIRCFLAQFTGRRGASEDPFEEADLAEMDELRSERDRAFDEFRRREATVFSRLNQIWDQHDLGDRHRLERPQV